MSTDAFQLRREFTVPKHDDGSQNEDKWKAHRGWGRYALSDGASVSFDSATWAQMLVCHYVRDPSIRRDSLKKVAQEFAKRFDWDNLPWHAQAAMERGNFASLLGIRYRAQGLLEIQAIGDTCGVLCDGDAIQQMFPLSHPSQFGNRPHLISTNLSENQFDEDGFLRWDWCGEFDLQDYQQPRLLCMTDALGLWFLEQSGLGVNPVRRLLELQDIGAFRTFVIDERASGRLRRDDTTLLVLW